MATGVCFQMRLSAATDFLYKSMHGISVDVMEELLSSLAGG